MAHIWDVSTLSTIDIASNSRERKCTFNASKGQTVLRREEEESRSEVEGRSRKEGKEEGSGRNGNIMMDLIVPFLQK